LIRAVLFDATGTLIELREPVGETYAREAAAQGLSISAWRLDDAFRRVFASRDPMCFPDAEREAVPALEKDWWRGVVRSTFLAADSANRLPDFDAGFERLWEAFSTAGAWRPRPGARSLLERLERAGVRRAVVSNFDHRLPALLDALGLGALIERVVLPCDAGVVKPDPRIFRQALDALDLRADEAVYVGDDAERDIAGAQSAGLRAVEAGSVANLDELLLPLGDP
jgi:putative hydrolase of the HAD superfamily